MQTAKLFTTLIDTASFFSNSSRESNPGIYYTKAIGSTVLGVGSSLYELHEGTYSLTTCMFAIAGDALTLASHLIWDGSDPKKDLTATTYIKMALAFGGTLLRGLYMRRAAYENRSSYERYDELSRKFFNVFQDGWVLLIPPKGSKGDTLAARIPAKDLNISMAELKRVLDPYKITVYLDTDKNVNLKGLTKEAIKHYQEHLASKWPTIRITR